MISGDIVRVFTNTDCVAKNDNCFEIGFVPEKRTIFQNFFFFFTIKTLLKNSEK